MHNQAISFVYIFQKGEIMNDKLHFWMGIFGLALVTTVITVATNQDIIENWVYLAVFGLASGLLVFLSLTGRKGPKIINGIDITQLDSADNWSRLISYRRSVTPVSRPQTQRSATPVSRPKTQRSTKHYVGEPYMVGYYVQFS